MIWATTGFNLYKPHLGPGEHVSERHHGLAASRGPVEDDVGTAVEGVDGSPLLPPHGLVHLLHAVAVQVAFVSQS